MFRLGTSLILFGVAALILPLFGLQFRKLQAAGENAPMVAIGLIVLGAVIDFAALLRARLKMALLIIGGSLAALVLLVMLLAAVPLLLRSFSGRPTGPPTGPPQLGNSSAPRWQPTPGNSLRPPSARPIAPATPTTPTAPSSSQGLPDPVKNMGDSLARIYGADNVIRINVHTPDVKTSFDPQISRRIREALRSCGAKSTPMWHSGTSITYVAAPVADLDALVGKLDLGTAPKIDRPTRTATFDLTAPPPPASPPQSP